MKKGFILAAFIVIVFLLHLISNMAKNHGMGWYLSLHLPVWAPTPVGLTRIWAGMFVFKTVAGALLWVAHKSRLRQLAIELWCALLALDMLWHFLFFYFENLLLASISILLLAITAGFLLHVSKRVDKAAFFLLIPYEGWLIYDVALNFTLLAMN